MTDVMFVVPAYRRLEVSAVAFASLAWTIEELALLGHEARALVIADDENLAIAERFGLDVLRWRNELGERLNEGFAHAAAADAEFVVYVGSDDLLDPALVDAQISEHRGLGSAADYTVIASRTSSVVSPDGLQMLNIRIGYECGDGVQLRPTRLLARLGHRPIPAGRNRAMDGAMWKALECTGPLAFSYVDAAPGQITDLKSNDVQVTAFEKFLDEISKPGDRITLDSESQDPWGDLSAIYPASVVGAAEQVYASAAVAA